MPSLSERQTTLGSVLLVGVLAPVIASAIIGVWSAPSLGLLADQLNSMRQTQVRIKRNQAVIQIQISRVQNRLEEIYTRNEAERAHQRLWRMERAQNDRLQKIEERLP